MYVDLFHREAIKLAELPQTLDKTSDNRTRAAVTDLAIKSSPTNMFKAPSLDHRPTRDELEALELRQGRLDHRHVLNDRGQNGPANAVFGTLYDQLGDAMRPLLNLEKWKPSLKDSVVAESEGVGFSPSSFAASRVAKTGVDGVEGRGGAASSGSLFGHVDVSAQNTKELLVDMANEGDKVDASNANLKTNAVQVIGVVAASVGPSVAKLAKLVGSNLVVGVADNKEAMQQACLDSLLPFVAMALKNPGGRAELLGWTVEMTQMIGSKVDLRSFVENTIDALSDKSTGACDKLLLVEVFKSVGRDTVHTGYRGMVSHIERHVLSLCVATVSRICRHAPYVGRSERVAIERVLLEAGAGFLEPRLGGKHIMMTMTALRIGEVYLAMLHVLERMVSGKVGEYQKHGADNKIAGQPTLGQLLAKLLVNTTGRELTLPMQFVHVDVVGILHTKHHDSAELNAVNLNGSGGSVTLWVPMPFGDMVKNHPKKNCVQVHVPELAAHLPTGVCCPDRFATTHYFIQMLAQTKTSS
ncbi:hypothetical protein DYB25_001107 [Aphanomyces astaci]|uniref:Uncharacterized protein n=2 Tax=Aphanomyces astaci TaxID=112090 RepID=A0A397A1U2_APHAT|nr:hypothetical protein DYB25_001107 [Aphanomyces astaci]RHZ12475.1 hypothetical protein DYB31_005164 [Aphanomyces astaci]